MDGNFLLNLPLYALIIAALIGFLGNWRRAITFLIFSYAALIIAAQHNAAITDTSVIRSLSGQTSYIPRSALAFVLTAIGAFVLLNVLFTVVWGKAKGYTRHNSGLDKLSQSLITGLTGWALGVILAISLLTYQGENLKSPGTSAEATFYTSAVDTTASTVIEFVDPWLPNDPPEFLEVWERSSE